MVRLKYYYLEHKRNILMITLCVLLCLSAASYFYFTKKNVTFLIDQDKYLRVDQIKKADCNHDPEPAAPMIEIVGVDIEQEMSRQTGDGQRRVEDNRYVHG